MAIKSIYLKWNSEHRGQLQFTFSSERSTIKSEGLEHSWEPGNGRGVIEKKEVKNKQYNPLL